MPTICIPDREKRIVPSNLVDLAKLYPTNAECLAWTEPIINCPRCGAPKLYWKPARREWRCPACGHDAPFSVGTAWHQSRLSLPKWFEIAWLLSDQTVSIRRLQKLTGVSRSALHHVVHAYREAMQHWAETQLLEGEVEVDETFLGWNGKKGRASRPAVMLIAERNHPSHGPRRVIATRMAGYTKASTCERLVMKHVKLGSFVYTDAWAGYKSLDWFGYNHSPINISKAPAPAHVYLPAVHSAANQLKQALKTYSRHPLPQNLPLYLGEWSWRYSHRNLSTGEKWALLIQLLNERTA